MDHYGYGELIVMGNWDKIKEVYLMLAQILDHHQFKYLVVGLVQVGGDTAEH